MANEEITLADNAITDVETVSDYLKIDPSDGDLFQFVTHWINVVSQIIEEEISGPVKARLFTEIHDGMGNQFIYPVHVPVLRPYVPESVEPPDWNRWFTVRDEPGPNTLWVDSGYDSSLCLVREDRPYAIEVYGGFFPLGIQNVKLCFYAGYDTIPGRITQVCVEKVAEIYQQSRQGDARLGQTSKVMNMGGQNATSNYYQLDPVHMKLLEPFRVSPYRLGSSYWGAI